MAFHEVQFPTDIAYGSSGGPAYSTDIVVTASGFEQRNVNWQQARARYNVAQGVKTQAQLDTLIAFFRARKGRAFGFRFKDWLDYEAAAEPLGTGDSSQQQFQLKRTYSSGNQSEERLIHKPVDGSVSIYVDGALQSSGWSVDTTTGIVTFDAAPQQNAIITADFVFDVPVRFDTDQLSARLNDYGASSWSDIPLVEVRI